MLLPTGATVAVADGEKLSLFRNSGHETDLKLTPLEVPALDTSNHGSGARHHTGAANHDHGQVDEDGHSAGVAALLNSQVTAGTIKQLVVIASPRALGELRRHFSKELDAVLLGEIAKDLTGQTTDNIAKAITAG